MKTSLFTKRPLCLLLGLAMLSAVAVPTHAQIVRSTNKDGVRSSLTESGTIDSRAGALRARLAPALAAFWASTEPRKSYMIFDTMVRRGIDGRVTWAEGTKSYTFGPEVKPQELIDNAPSFVALLLGQYATQERVGLVELENALADYFASTRPGEGTSKPGGQLMRNSDGSATFTDGKIIFVFDEATSAGTVALMAPTLAAALTNLSGAIVSGEPTGYALRDPSNANQLINYDGRMYDTAGNALGSASPATVAALFGKGNGSSSANGSNGGSSANGAGGNAGSGSGSSSGGNSGGTGGNSANSGYGSGNGSSNGGTSTGNATGNAWGGSGSGTGSGAGSSGNNTGNSGATGSDTNGSGWGGNNGTGGSSAGGTGAGTGAGNGSNTNAGTGSSTGNGATTGNNGGSNNGNGTNGANNSANNGPGPNANGNASGSTTGYGLYGNTNLSTGAATGVNNATYGTSMPNTGTAPVGSNCQMVRSLNGGGGFTCE